MQEGPLIILYSVIAGIIVTLASPYLRKELKSIIKKLKSIIEENEDFSLLLKMFAIIIFLCIMIYLIVNQLLNSSKMPESFYVNYLIAERRQLSFKETDEVHARSSGNPMTYGHEDLDRYIPATPGWEIDVENMELPGGLHFGQMEVASGATKIEMFPRGSWSWRDDNRGMGTRIIGFHHVSPLGFWVKAHISTERSSPRPFAGRENGFLRLQVTFPEIQPASMDRTHNVDFDGGQASLTIPATDPERNVTPQGIVLCYPDGSEKQIPISGNQNVEVSYSEENKQVTVTIK
jgi:hypothetical protein